MIASASMPWLRFVFVTNVIAVCWLADGLMAQARSFLRSTPARVFHSSAVMSSNGRGLRVTKSRRPLVGGLSTSPISSDQETQISGLALGKPDNNVPGAFTAAVVTNLPGSIDGILDPTEVFSPFGYSVDLPNRELRVFDTHVATATSVRRAA